MAKKIIIASISIFIIGLFFLWNISDNLSSLVAADGNFTMNVSAGPNNPNGGQVINNSRGLTMLEFKLDVLGADGLKISSLRFNVQKNNLEPASSSELNNFRLYDSETQLGKIGQGVNPANGEIIFENFNLYIPKNGSKTLTIRGDLAQTADMEKFRVIFGSSNIFRSGISGQKSDSKPSVHGKIFGNFFYPSDKYILVTEPWHGLVWSPGQTYNIGWNQHLIVDKINLALIGYQTENEASPSIVIPIAYDHPVNAKLSFDRYQYTLPDSISQHLNTYKYFKIRAIYKIPSPSSQIETQESFSSGFFTIGQQRIELEAEVVRAQGDYKVYRIIQARKLWITTVEGFKALGYKPSDIKQVSQGQLDSYPKVYLLKSENSNKVYYLTDMGLVRYIPSQEVFESYGNNWEDVIEISSKELSYYEENNLVRAEGDGKVYKLDNGKKRWIKTLRAFERNHFDWSRVALISRTELDAYPERSAIR